MNYLKLSYREFATHLKDLVLEKKFNEICDYALIVSKGEGGLELNTKKDMPDTSCLSRGDNIICGISGLVENYPGEYHCRFRSAWYRPRHIIKGVNEEPFTEEQILFKNEEGSYLITDENLGSLVVLYLDHNIYPIGERSRYCTLNILMPQAREAVREFFEKIKGNLEKKIKEIERKKIQIDINKKVEKLKKQIDDVIKKYSK